MRKVTGGKQVVQSPKNINPSIKPEISVGKDGAFNRGTNTEAETDFLRLLCLKKQKNFSNYTKTLKFVADLYPIMRRTRA